MSHYRGAVWVFCVCLALNGAVTWQNSLTAGAQTEPPPTSLTQQERQELEELREAERIRAAIEENLENSGEIQRLIQSEVDRAFDSSTDLINILLTVLTLLPIFAAIGLLLLRRSVINQIVSETRKQLREEVERQLTEEVTSELAQQAKQFNQEIETLKCGFIDQISNLQSLFKEQIVQAIDNLTPSPSQQDTVSPEVKRRIQELTEQLNALKSAAPELLLTADDHATEGEAFYFEGRYEDALKSYDKALQLQPNNPTVWINRAITLRRLQRCEEAIASHDKALELAPNSTRAWYTKGYTLRSFQRYETALACYEHTLKLDPNAFRTWDNCGSVLKEMGRYEEAIASYDRAVKISPHYANAWNHKARCYAQWGKVELAIECLQKSIELRPEYFNHIATEPDFDPIREAVKFKQLIRAGQLSQII